jgi:hypothetical protein
MLWILHSFIYMRVRAILKVRKGTTTGFSEAYRKSVSTPQEASSHLALHKSN